MKICQYAFGGHGKDGASGKGDPQTNAFTGEGIKPRALKVRVGLNCAALLKIQQKHLFFSECSRCVRLDLLYVGEKKSTPFSLKISRVHWGANICIKLENLPDRVTALCEILERFYWSHAPCTKSTSIPNQRVVSSGENIPNILHRSSSKIVAIGSPSFQDIPSQHRD